MFLCNQAPTRGLKVLLCPHQRLFPSFSSQSSLHRWPQNNQASYFFRAAEFPNARHLLIDVNWNFYPPPSLYLVSRTFGLLGFDIDGNAAFRIPKKQTKNPSQTWLEGVCSLSALVASSVFKDILAAFIVLFLHFCVGLLIYSKVLHLFSPLFKRQACVHCVNGTGFCLDVCFLQVCVSARVCFVVFGLIPIIPQVCLCCLLLGAQVSPFCCL